MWLVVGLGNPGRQYENNRHNIGFMMLDAVASYYRFPSFQVKRNKALSTGHIQEQKVILLKPLQFMNLSGPPVSEIMRFFKIPLDCVIVIYDDLDMKGGKVRLKKGGGTAGHRGIESLQASIGTNFWRLKIGIDHPGEKSMVSSYVLSDFIGREKIWLAPLKKAVSEFFSLILEQKEELYVTKVMQHMHFQKES